MGRGPSPKCFGLVSYLFSVRPSEIQIHDGAQILFYVLMFHEPHSNVDHFFSATEQPGSLHSSQGLGMGPVEESWFAPSLEHQQEENEPSLQSKLQEEANYHLYGSRMDRQMKQQPRQNVAYNREEERRRRVSHDPFAQQRPYENFQNTEVKGTAYSSAASHGNAVPQPSGLSSQPQVPYRNNVLYSSHGFGTRPLDPGTAGPRVWYGPIPSPMSSLYKIPVPETNYLGNTPTMPFTSLPLTGKWVFDSHNLVFFYFSESKATNQLYCRLWVVMGTEGIVHGQMQVAAVEWTPPGHLVWECFIWG